MKLGAIDIELLSAGYLSLDGGAMFGVVPKTLWSRNTAADEKNRIRLGTNCLLLRTGAQNVLIDTGCGDKYSEKEISIYGIEQPPTLVESLRGCGLGPEDIHIVINTHLHFDHCGGNTRIRDHEVVPGFENALYYVQRQEYDDATHTNERTRATYFPHNWAVLEERDQLRLLDGDGEILPGISVIRTPGHTLGHQSVKIESGGRTVFYIADLCPTTAHVPLAWIMGYDLHPMVTLETRKKVYREAVENDWLICFEHDPEYPLGSLKLEDGRYKVQRRSWDG